MDYSLYPTIPVLIERSNLDQKWGFRLQGGADFRLPLSIKKIIPNTPSHNKLYPGDGLMFIDGQDVSTMKHEDAQYIMRNSLRLQLILRRGLLNTVRPSKASVKFAPGPNPRVNPALYNTTTPNNYRRF
ncbi:unnamed protein product [Adineta steineri]|uniref:PDZ domain-containing protein n=3 Tax=Adineta steineri TaxID=433720 RepID=A0A814JDN7_9BILA|nr:unnamed protein product [Adineta steineri]CAF0824814.1 unnamed protein product [Adineta steineri]CAF1036167.1 unnamed protein product [Adineta steineri]CAF3509409.1 unnamed protein product [Adineta steineri]CAF3767533.1 unnamed protein product [Adineta steineri]